MGAVFAKAPIESAVVAVQVGQIYFFARCRYCRRDASTPARNGLGARAVWGGCTLARGGKHSFSDAHLTPTTKPRPFASSVVPSKDHISREAPPGILRRFSTFNRRLSRGWVGAVV
jgi:hypothetical protein